MEGSEEALQSLSDTLSSYFGKKYAEAQARVDEFKAIGQNLTTGGKTLSRDPNSYDSVLEGLSSKIINARNRCLATSGSKG